MKSILVTLVFAPLFAAVVAGLFGRRIGDRLSMIVTTGLQLALLYVPFLARFFGTVPLAGQDLLICVGVSLTFFLYLELEKLVRIWSRRRHADS